MIAPLFSRPATSSFSDHESHLKSYQQEALSQIAALDPEIINAKWQCHLDSLFKLVDKQSDPKVKTYLKTILGKLNSDNLNCFFDFLVDHAAEHEFKNLESIFNIIPLEILLKTIQQEYPQQFTTIEEYLEQIALAISDQESPSIDYPIPHNIQPATNPAISFLSNLNHIFSRAFAIFDAPRPPDTIYEYGVIVTLYINFLSIPYHLTKGLSHLIPNPWKLLTTVTLMTGFIIASLQAYLRWLKGSPKQVDYCLNWTEKLNGDIHRQAFCRTQEIEEAALHLGKGRCVALVGEPGTGKTHLMHSLVSQVNRTAFAFDNCKLFGVGSSILSTAEKMSVAFQQVKGYEQDLFFLCDELGDALVSKFNDIISVFKVMKDEYPHIALITAITKDQWNALIKTDKALEERFKPIFLKPTNEIETLRILQKRVNGKIGVTQGGLQKLVKDNAHITDHAEPRKSINTFEELRLRIESFDPEKITTEKLQLAEINLANLKGRASLVDDPLSHPFSSKSTEYLKQLREANADLKEAVLEIEDQKRLAKRVITWQKLQRVMLDERNEALRRLTSLPKDEKRWKTKLLFINFFALKRIEQHVGKVSHELARLNPNIRLLI